MRWTWIDRFVAFEPRKSAVAVKSLSLAEDHFADHFPGFPVMPATLAAGRAGPDRRHPRRAREQLRKERRSGEDVGKFHRDASAGEQLTYTATLLDLNDTGARVSGTVAGADGPVAEAEIMFAHVAPSQLPPPGLPDTKFVFTASSPTCCGSGDQESGSGDRSPAGRQKRRV